MWIAVVVAFHLSTFALMQLLFFHNLVLLPLLMLDWQRPFERFAPPERMRAARDPRR